MIHQNCLQISLRTSLPLTAGFPTAVLLTVCIMINIPCSPSSPGPWPLLNLHPHTRAFIAHHRAEEAEELTVLKLGKVLGRGGSGLVFQGYLHLGLEVAVKLFENPDDTDPDAISSDESPSIGNLNPDGSSIGPDAMGASRGADGGSSVKDGSKGPEGNGGAQRRNSSRSAAQMTKRQRDLLRNALELGVTSSVSHPNIVQVTTAYGKEDERAGIAHSLTARNC